MSYHNGFFPNRAPHVSIWINAGGYNGYGGYGGYYGGPVCHPYFARNYYQPRTTLWFNFHGGAHEAGIHQSPRRDDRFYTDDIHELARSDSHVPEALRLAARRTLALGDTPEYDKAAHLIRAIKHSDAGHFLGRARLESPEAAEMAANALLATNFNKGSMERLDNLWHKCRGKGDQYTMDAMANFIAENGGHAGYRDAQYTPAQDNAPQQRTAGANAPASTSPQQRTAGTATSPASATTASRTPTPQERAQLQAQITTDADKAFKAQMDGDVTNDKLSLSGIRQFLNDNQVRTDQLEAAIPQIKQGAFVTSDNSLALVNLYKQYKEADGNPDAQKQILAQINEAAVKAARTTSTHDVDISPADKASAQQFVASLGQQQPTTAAAKPGAQSEFTRDYSSGDRKIVATMHPDGNLSVSINGKAPIEVKFAGTEEQKNSARHNMLESFGAVLTSKPEELAKNYQTALDTIKTGVENKSVELTATDNAKLQADFAMNNARQNASFSAQDISTRGRDVQAGRSANIG